MNKISPLWMLPFFAVAILMAQCVFMYACPYIWLAKIILGISGILFLLAVIFSKKDAP